MQFVRSFFYIYTYTRPYITYGLTSCIYALYKGKVLEKRYKGKFPTWPIDHSALSYIYIERERVEASLLSCLNLFVLPCDGGGLKNRNATRGTLVWRTVVVVFLNIYLYVYICLFLIEFRTPAEGCEDTVQPIGINWKHKRIDQALGRQDFSEYIYKKDDWFTITLPSNPAPPPNLCIYTFAVLILKEEKLRFTRHYFLHV